MGFHLPFASTAVLHIATFEAILPSSSDSWSRGSFLSRTSSAAATELADSTCLRALRWDDPQRHLPLASSQLRRQAAEGVAVIVASFTSFTVERVVAWPTAFATSSLDSATGWSSSAASSVAVGSSCLVVITAIVQRTCPSGWQATIAIASYRATAEAVLAASCHPSYQTDRLRELVPSWELKLAQPPLVQRLPTSCIYD